MTPIFEVYANKTDITGQIKDRLLSISTTDEAKYKSDTVEIRIDDRDGKMIVPNTGAELDVFLGYQETKLTHIGLYTVDEIGLEGPPATLIIPAKATNMKKSLKVQKSRSWDNITYGALVAKIAAEHGLDPKVSEDLAVLLIAHVDQTNESDLHLLTRLAKQHDAIAKPVMGKLLLLPHGEAKSVSGKTLETVALRRKDLSDQNGWSYRSADRGKYDSVKAFWYNKDVAEKVEEMVGQAGRTYTLRHTYPSALEAKTAAKAKHSALNRGKETLELSTTLGQPKIRAEGKISISGVRDKVNTEWSVVRVEHDFSEAGFTSQIEAETPKK